MWSKIAPPYLLQTLFSVDYVTDCVVNMLSIWWMKQQHNADTMLCTRCVNALKYNSLPKLQPLKTSQVFKTANNLWLSVLLLSCFISSFFQLIPTVFFPLPSAPSLHPSFESNRHLSRLPCVVDTLLPQRNQLSRPCSRGKEAIMKECSSFADDSRGH